MRRTRAFSWPLKILPVAGKPDIDEFGELHLQKQEAVQELMQMRLTKDTTMLTVYAAPA